MSTIGSRRRTLLAALALTTCLAGAHPAGGAERIGAEAARAWKPHLETARDFAGSRTGQVSVAVYDMRGRLHHFGGGHRYPMASTIKVMLMVAYLRSGSVDDRDLDGDEKRLLRRMIRRSDNRAATRIRDLLGREPIERLAQVSGMKHFVWSDVWGYCRSSARDQALFMRTLRRWVPNRHWHFAKRQLASIVPSQRWGIAEARPAGWRLYFKGGWGSGPGAVEHQIALLAREGRRVGVSIMTDGSPSHGYARNTLEGVAERLLRGLPR